MRKDKWDIAPLEYPFGNGINFQLEVENVDKRMQDITGELDGLSSMNHKTSLLAKEIGVIASILVPFNS